jgi:hypothetical protein
MWKVGPMGPCSENSDKARLCRTLTILPSLGLSFPRGGAQYCCESLWLDRVSILPVSTEILLPWGNPPWSRWRCSMLHILEASDVFLHSTFATCESLTHYFQGYGWGNPQGMRRQTGISPRGNYYFPGLQGKGRKQRTWAQWMLGQGNRKKCLEFAFLSLLISCYCLY